MNSGPKEFQKIWIDQCEATEGIREQFHSEDALNYLIGEKLSFLYAAERDPLFAAEVNAFIGEIHRLKLIKRQMDGRASLDLLRLRVLHST